MFEFLGYPKQVKTVHKRVEYFGQDSHCFGSNLKIWYIILVVQKL